MDKEYFIKLITGLLPILLFLLITNPLLKLLMAVIYIIYSIFSGFRVKLLPNIILLFSIILINLLSPQGLILFKIGPQAITKGALLSGINRASILIGLLYISKNISLKSVKFRGVAGEIISDTFFYFNQLTSGNRVVFKNFMDQIDTKLMELTHIKDEKTTNTNIKTNNTNKFFLLIATTLILLIDKYLLTF